MIAAEPISEIQAALPKSLSRMIVAVAGAPASGKSTLAEGLVQTLRGNGRSAVLVPMDGFHLDNRILEARGLRPRKGAPETFDAAGFNALLQRIKHGETVVAPVFDRDLDLAIANAEVISGDADVIVVEGNYLLFDDPSWRGLTDLWDFRVFLDVPIDVLEARLVQRWLDHGFTKAEALEKAMSNDIPNARQVMERSLPTDLVVKN